MPAGITHHTDHSEVMVLMKMEMKMKMGAEERMKRESQLPVYFDAPRISKRSGSAFNACSAPTANCSTGDFASTSATTR